MISFKELYDRLVKASIQNNLVEELDTLHVYDDFDPYQLDCLLNPQKYAPVLSIGDCECNDEEKKNCINRCLFDALYIDEKGNVAVDKDHCVGCAECVGNCHAKKLFESKDIIPTLAAIYDPKVPVYAMIAPAFVNQYSSEVTPGKLRSAFKRLGFTGMVEVALFADILTLKEALEFDKNIVDEEDFQLTSCCCPIWIAMIRKVYKQLIPRVPGSVSPMVACGRSIKQIHPDALTVFIGPCVAKKAEAREKDVADSTDFVLTFQEMQDIFNYAGIDPSKMEEDVRDHSSRAGRIYATTGGVSEAVERTLERISPDRKVRIETVYADGVPACRAMLNDILSGKRTANFIEGMGCVGGCVGGPKILIPKEEGRENVFEYGKRATYQTPIDNPYVIELLHRLGFDTVESLLEDNHIFTRNI
ncbi:MAG: iron hydrogenase [Clostridiales bacterium]|nr:iron hydrogenase [Clostridiales bacterium]